MSYVPPPIIFGQPWFDQTEEDLLVQTLRSGWIGQGPLVERFENELAEYVGAKHVVTVSSCTAALHLSLVAAGIGEGDEVITTPFTFVATVNAIEHAGAKAVFADINPDSLNLDPEAVAAVITPRTKAIMPVHFGGHPVNLDRFYELAEKHDLLIVEDAAHAVGTVFNGRRVGGSGNPRSLACFSFYPNKNLATAEGGAIALADDHLNERLRSLRLHGLEGDAWSRYRRSSYAPSLATYPGYKYNFTDLQASIAIGQLQKLEGFMATREYLAETYDRGIAEVPGVRALDRGTPSAGWRHALHLYQVVVEGDRANRDRVLNQLRSRAIGAAVHYVSVNQHPYYREAYPEAYPHSDWASDVLITLPLHVHMTTADVDRVVNELASAIATK